MVMGFRVALVFVVGFVSAISVRAAETVRFNRDIRPILSDRCFPCHGPDEQERKAGLRLDIREEAIRERDGRWAIVPGKPKESQLIHRIQHLDPVDRMPPENSGRVLTVADRQLLTSWIRQGAPYEEHWAFLAPQRPEPPDMGLDGPAHPIDRFILRALEQRGLGFSPRADRGRLLRRLTFDLTGLPPTEMELDAFLADPSSDAVERAIDRLLASDRYGEHMAVSWLDAARFADTNGYNNDTPRANWKWRDWVIEAFNRNLPGDRFVVEQIAGDLLPNPTLNQRVATGFNRNHSVTSEGGIIDEEYRLEYVADRVHTTSLVFMGLSLQCARCHDHKFDPISQREYYQFFAFFNQVPESGYHHEHVGNPNPVVSLATPSQQQALDQLNSEVRALEVEVAKVAEGESLAEEARSSLSERLERTKKERQALQKSIPTAMVMQDMASMRDTFVLGRGAYDRPGESVRPEVPDALSPFPEGAPRNRLGLAEWLVADDHPLTARVMVNRLWYQMFGRGLVETVEDFGSQGAWPSHPELLDWLTCEFVSGGWDIKRLLKLMATSHTYQQSAGAEADYRRLDPENQWYASGPRVRLTGEMIRDNALALSGLLQHRLGGPSVRPYQPEGLWEEVAVADASYSGGAYQQDHDENLYRRGVYTWWKRTCPPPSLSSFDAPNREFCSVRRGATNTPLQALVLLNDPTFVEAARVFAERIMTEGGASTDSRIEFAFRLTTSRRAQLSEIEILRKALETQRARFQQLPGMAKELIHVGETPANPELSPTELAAWSLLASMLLNLDETIHR